MAQATIHLAREASSARVAREFVRRTLVDWQCPPSVSEDAVLLTSELVTNAVLHAGDVRSDHDDVQLRLRQIRGGVRVHVIDKSDVVLVAARHPTAEGGRGLHLVDAIATRWGTVPNGTGKIVWIELDF